ncbi:MAG: response regulator [Candidatus Obscuribacterales bacterium]|nr:response regulator [Candidatus Obscuribacterales bacterium]
MPSSDNAVKGADRASELIHQLERQVNALKDDLSASRSQLASISGLEKSVKEILESESHLELSKVPGIIMKLSKERSIGAALTSEDGQVLMASPGFYALTGLSLGSNASSYRFFSASDNLSLDSENLKELDGCPWLKHDSDKNLGIGLAIHRYLARKDEEQIEKWLQFIYKALTEDGGETAGALIFVVESTDEVNNEKQIGALINQLKDKIDAISAPINSFRSVLDRVLEFKEFGPVSATLPAVDTSLGKPPAEDFFPPPELDADSGEPDFGTFDHLNSDTFLPRDRQEMIPPPPCAADETESAIDEILPVADAVASEFQLEPVVRSDEKEDGAAEPEVLSDDESEEAAEEKIDDESLAEASVDGQTAGDQDDNRDISEVLQNEDSSAESIGDIVSLENSQDSDSDGSILLNELEDSDLLVDDGEGALWQEFSDFVKETPLLSNEGDDSVSFEEFEVEQGNLETTPPADAKPEQELVSEPDMISEDKGEPSLAEIEAGILEFSPLSASELNAPSSEPVALNSEVELSYSDSTPESVDEAKPSFSERWALVVDDIPVNQKLLVHQLKKLGFKTDIANNGAEAIEMLKKPYTIIFMDCDMPVMNGYEATAEIRKKENGRSHVPIIAMTSYDRETDKEKCLAAGMDDYLTKGVNEGTLSRVIETALSGESLQGNGSADQVVQAQIADTMSGGETMPFDADNIAATYSRDELKDIMRSFLSSMEVFVGSMQKAIDDHDVDKVRHLSNSIKGPCASLGLKLMTRVAADIINYAQAADWPQVRLKYLKLKTVYLRSQADLRKACPEVFEEAHHIIG